MAAVLSTWCVLLGLDTWRISTQAEVYSLNLAWVAAVIWTSYRWTLCLDRRWLVVLLVVYALSFGNHLTMITLLPALLFLVLAYDHKALRDPKIVLAGVVSVGVGFAQYGLLWWRSYNPHPTLLPGFPLEATWPELFEYVSGARFTDSKFLSDGLLALPLRAGEAGVHGVWQLTPGLLLLGIWGGYVLWKQNPRFTSFLVLGAIGELLFATAYDIRGWLYYCVPVWFVCGLFGAVGLGRSSAFNRPIRLLIYGILVLSLGGSIPFKIAALRSDEQPHDYAELIEQVTTSRSYLLVHPRSRRQAGLARSYYRLGVEMEGARYISFTTAEAVFETLPRYLENRPVYFRDPRIERFLRKSRTDYVVRRLPSGQTYFVTGTETPVVRLIVKPAASGGMFWRFSDRDRFLTQDGQVHLAFVSRRDGRVKGVERLRLESPAALDRTNVLLDHLSDGDWVILVAGDVTQEGWLQVLDFLRGQRIDDPELSGSARNLVAVWRKGDVPSDKTLVLDPAQRLRISLPQAQPRFGNVRPSF